MKSLSQNVHPQSHWKGKVMANSTVVLQIVIWKWHTPLDFIGPWKSHEHISLQGGREVPSYHMHFWRNDRWDLLPCNTTFTYFSTFQFGVPSLKSILKCLYHDHLPTNYFPEHMILPISSVLTILFKIKIILTC